MARNYTVTELSNVLSPVFRRYDVDRAVLFGSRAKGTNAPNSDIDLLVDSKLKGLRFIGLVEAVRDAVQLDVDMFDVRHIEKNSMVDREIRDTGVLIYEKPASPS